MGSGKALIKPSGSPMQNKGLMNKNDPVIAYDDAPMAPVMVGPTEAVAAGDGTLQTPDVLAN